MIPPPPRACGDDPKSGHERVEEALVYIFEINEHEGSRLCGSRFDDPTRVLCCRCIARNALMEVGWTLNPREEALERRLGLLSESGRQEPMLGLVHNH